MKKAITIFLLFLYSQLFAPPPYAVKDNLQNRINEDIYYKLNKLSLRTVVVEKKTTDLGDIYASDVITMPRNNLQSYNAQDTFYELDREKLHRKDCGNVLWNTMEKNLILGGSVNTTTNLSIGADTTPSYPIQIDRKAPQIVIKNSGGSYSFGISVPESTANKYFNIHEVGVKTWLTLSPYYDMIFLNDRLTIGSNTDTGKYFERQNYGISFSSGMNILGKQLYLGDLSRYFADDTANYEIDLSTGLNITGNLNVSDYTTLSSFTASGLGKIEGTATVVKETYLSTFTASGYGVVNTTFTVGGMIYCSSITPTGTVDGYDVSAEFYNLKIDTGTLDSVKLDKSSATATYVFKTGDTMTGNLTVPQINVSSVIVNGSGNFKDVKIKQKFDPYYEVFILSATVRDLWVLNLFGE